MMTKQSIVNFIAVHGPAKVIGRACAAIYARQTADEQSSNATICRNGIGFSGNDARVGSLTAKRWNTANTIDPWMVKYWSKLDKNGFPKICKYLKQLNEIANENHVAHSK